MPDRKQYKVLKADPKHPEWVAGQTAPVSLTEEEARQFVANGTLRLATPADEKKPEQD